MDVPEGRIHRADVLARGWTAAMADLLTDVVRISGVPAGVSPRCYLISEVEELERSDSTIRKAVEAAASQIPRREGGYRWDETITKAALLRQGWTQAHIDRLLGAPDLVEAGSYPVHGYAIERINQAAATDHKLIKRLEEAGDARRAKTEQRIAEVLEDGRAVWRKVDGRWLAQGRGLEEGDVVTVARRNGETARHRVEQIVSDEQGVQLAIVSKQPIDATATQPASTTQPGERPMTATQPKPVAAGDVGGMCLERVQPGDVVNLRGRWIQITKAWTVRVDEDSPSMFGAEFLGHESDTATGYQGLDLAVTDPARARELEAARAAADRQAQQRQDAARARENRRREIAQLIRQASQPFDETGIVIGGRRLSDRQNIYGGGDWFEVTDTHLWWVLNNGADGDNWAHNNVRTGGAGAIGYKIALDPDLVNELELIQRNEQGTP